MEIMKPFDVTDTTLTSSSIAEPDIASGEVEWVDSNVLPTFTVPTKDFLTSQVGVDGFIYTVGSSSSGVLRVNPSDNTSTQISTTSFSYEASVINKAGVMYCVGLGGNVLKVNTQNQVVTTFGSYADNYRAASIVGDRFIYCFGSDDTVLKIDTDLETLSSIPLVIGAGGVYLTSQIAVDGFIYIAGALSFSPVIKFNTIDESTTLIGELNQFDRYFTSEIGTDGNIYCFGDTNNILKINIKDQALERFGNIANDSIYRASKTGVDGKIYAIGTIGKLLSLDVVTSEVLEFGGNSVTYKSASLAGNGSVYCFGDSGESLIIPPPYEVNDEVIKSVTHKAYRSASVNRDDPEVGITLVPPTWVELRYTNKYRMFNDAKDSKSTATTDIVTEYDFNKSVTTVATLGVIGTSVKVTVTDPVDGIVYEVEKETADAGVNDFWAFWFEPYTFREDLVFDNMPPGYPDTTVKVEVKATSGERAVGRVLSGLPVNIGVTNEPTTVGRQNFTLRTRDGFGNLTITPKRSIKVLNYDVAVNKNDLDSTDRVLESVGKIPALYIGEGDLESMICFGMAEDYRMDHNSAFSNMRLEVKEI